MVIRDEALVVLPVLQQVRLEITMDGVVLERIHLLLGLLLYHRSLRTLNELIGEEEVLEATIM